MLLQQLLGVFRNHIVPLRHLATSAQQGTADNTLDRMTIPQRHGEGLVTVHRAETRMEHEQRRTFAPAVERHQQRLTRLPLDACRLFRDAGMGHQLADAQRSLAGIADPLLEHQQQQ